MSEQLMIDFDPRATAARIAAEEEVAAAYAELVVELVVTEADAREHDLWLTPSDGGRLTVLVCPACGQYEANEFLICNNHGLSREYLYKRGDGAWVTTGREYGRQWCVALDLTSRHLAGDCHLSESQTQMLGRLRPEVRERFDREVADVRQRIEARQIGR
ncbi:hypothetical protein [Mycolicibacterium farcinogenes]|uniref:Uncharacterized protein n=1 Tax=Mycolicibacterium farcinogenes TaxID=1802 RepID=A0ACD1FR28_MYCFR|nr:hypothetical protein [Mycolicibacterium farcinogenes]QZH69416.1 hypothetical protein K6L26_30950 [Mycolicibacterium farcinogenes]